MIPKLSCKFLPDLHLIEASQWQDLAQGKGPFLSYAFLSALEQTGCVGAQSGWQPQHLGIYQGTDLIGVLPLYIKGHSYGEYVFDFAWAEAYRRHGHRYYPKLVSAIPFTPVPGPRLLLCEGFPLNSLWPVVADFIKAYCQEKKFSSTHILFPDAEQSRQLQEQSFMQRHSVQFHWQNQGYRDFADFVSCFTSRKRKNLNKERAKLRAQGVHCQRLNAGQIDESSLDFFIHCYQQTYLKRSGHRGYLSPAFFHQIRHRLAHQMMLVVATCADRPVAASLFFFDENSLYGRYWGCTEEIDGLHFEACYYQGIEFCIERGLAHFNPGTQGEHKILRGFAPTLCYSNHYIADPIFQPAIARYLAEESVQLQQYLQTATQWLPFRTDLG